MRAVAPPGRRPRLHTADRIGRVVRTIIEAHAAIAYNVKENRRQIRVTNLMGGR